jgi:cytochrome c-type biogenesis protein CcmF
MEIAGFTLRFEGTERVPGPNFIADRATVTLLVDGEIIDTVFPEKRQFVSSTMVTTNSSIRTNGIADLYVILGDARDNGAWVISAYYNPLAPLIWIGAVIMALGGLTSLAVRISRARAAHAVPEGAKGAVP